jgi:DNA-binding response OmpR family regulator
MMEPANGSEAPAPSEERQSILLVDDDMTYCRLVSKYLDKHGYDVTLVHNGKNGLETALARNWDAVLLDIMLPDLGGIEVLRSVRQQSNMPVLMLTALGDETDIVVGLELGADDYLPKSCSPRQILARLRAVLRRSQQTRSPAGVGGDPIIAGPLHIHIPTREVTLAGDMVPLTATEFDLLVALVKARGRILTREQLLDVATVTNSESCDRSIDVHISSLRRKLNDDVKNPRFIRTIRFMGYMFVDGDETGL